MVLKFYIVKLAKAAGPRACCAAGVGPAEQVRVNLDSISRRLLATSRRNGATAHRHSQRASKSKLVQRLEGASARLLSPQLTQTLRRTWQMNGLTSLVAAAALQSARATSQVAGGGQRKQVAATNEQQPTPTDPLLRYAMLSTGSCTTQGSLRPWRQAFSSSSSDPSPIDRAACEALEAMHAVACMARCHGGQKSQELMRLQVCGTDEPLGAIKAYVGLGPSPGAGKENSRRVDAQSHPASCSEALAAYAYL